MPERTCTCTVLTGYEWMPEEKRPKDAPWIGVKTDRNCPLHGTNGSQKVEVRYAA